MVNSINAGMATEAYDPKTVDIIEDDTEEQMLHFQPHHVKEIENHLSFDNEEKEEKHPIGGALAAFASIMGLDNLENVDPRGMTEEGSGIFGNVMGHSPVQIEKDGIEQNANMGFIPNDGVKANLIKNGV